MRPFHALAMIALSLAGGADGAAASDDPLAAYRWKARLLVLAAPDPADPRLAAQRGILEAAKAGAGERDLVTVEAIGAAGQAPQMRRRLSLPADAFRAVLVGKDGEAKIVSVEPITADRLFGTIDAMPMRRDEMRK